MARLPGYMKATPRGRDQAGWLVLSIEVRAWHPGFWALLWRELAGHGVPAWDRPPLIARMVLGHLLGTHRG